MTTIDVVVPVYKPGAYFRQTLTGLITQEVDVTTHLNIIVVDDGSHDDSLTALIREFPVINLLTLPENGGRSKARNSGANYGGGDFILFLDADCEPDSHNLIKAHCRVFEKGVDVSFGATKPQIKSNAFWVGYLADVENKRRATANRGHFLALTSQHFAIRRTVFIECGGFDERYRHYGFEDRDLIATLIKKNARMHYSPELIVRHDVDIALTDICKKMEEAGQHTAGLFANKFPELYATMSYSYFDLRRHPVALRVPLFCSVLMMPVLVKPVDKLLALPWLPKSFSYLLVRLFSGLAFLNGTWKAVNST